MALRQWALARFPMLLRPLCLLLASLCLLAVPLVATAQADAAPPDDAVQSGPPEPSAKERSAAAQAEFDARVQDLRQKIAAASDGEERYQLLDQLSDAYFKASRVGEAMRVSDEIVNDAKIGAGRRSLRASQLALSWAISGDFARSQRYLASAKSLARDATPAELESLPREPGYAFLRAEAEIARRAQNRHEYALSKIRELSNLARRNLNDPGLSGKRHQAATNELLDNVQMQVRLLVMNNRRQEAMSYVSEIQLVIKSGRELKATPVQAASINVAEAIALSSQDDYDAALAAINTALATFQGLQLPEFDGRVNEARRMRLMVALSLGKIRDYANDAEAWMRARGVNPVIAGSVSMGESDSLALATRGQWSDAILRVDGSIANQVRHQGTESPFTKYLTAMRMLYRLNDSAKPATQSDIERYVANLANDDPDWADGSFRGAYVEDGALSTSLGTLVPAGTPVSDSAAALAFRISELLRSNSSQGALADGAARLAAGNPALRSLVEQEQLLRFERNASRQQFAREADRADRIAKNPPADPMVAERSAKAQAIEVAEKAKTLEASNERLKQLRRQISAQFPVYRELVSPNIPSAAKLGSVLRPGEVYVNLYSAANAGFAFIVQPGGKLVAMRLDITRERTRNLIAALRKPFDAASPPEQEGDAGGFDLAASHALYAAWLAPLKDHLQGAKIIYISAGGPLSSLPWNALVTAPAASLADASWWVAQVAPMQMPSASSLVLARTLPRREATRPFVAFADPSFNGRERSAAKASKRSVRESPFASDVTPQTIDYRRLQRLPETLDEVNAIGAALNAGDGSILTGTAASRTRVMKEDISDVRVVAFATHGLLPGELPGMPYAGLALAYEGQGLKDSVLTIDDVVGLRLNADWVVLSACNTGFANGWGGDSMSALSRGFFAAGTRTVLATQWAVESQSASELTVGVFKALAADTSLSKADALVRTQRDMIEGKYGALYRHPYFWAPYSAAGDAARP
ncbi:CHAT domain-containing protein [Variovorax rhizosphaerae]|uniref:CHAT domain-containing protein n=1 Tax=Variovorax rhizosphaerae TaxID=1836200 RepID=A0ABU8WZE9_9BURK